MKIVSGIIMLIGAFFTIIEFVASESAPQQAASVVFVVGAYVTGRALENFVSKEEKTIQIASTGNLNESALIRSYKRDAEFVKVQYKSEEPKMISRMEWAGILDDKRDSDYTIIDYYKRPNN